MTKERIYVDEPLPIFEGPRCIGRPAREERAALMTMSERYAQMRALAYELRGHARAEVFCRQAAYMNDFEENEDIRASFFCYYPTFAEMSARELRAYYAWRTAWLRGARRATSLSFAYVRLYELINSIGSPTPEAAFDALVAFVDDYKRIDRSIAFHARNWIKDFIIYHGLDRKLLAKPQRSETEEAALSLLEIGSTAPKLVFAAFRKLSSWPLKGAFFEANAEKLERLILAVIRKLSLTTTEAGQNALEAVIGPRLRLSYQPFAAAVFWDRRLREDRVFEADPMVRYRCANGRWLREELSVPGRGKNPTLGSLAKRVEGLLRVQLKFPRKLAIPDVPPLIAHMIDEAFEEEAARERDAANPVRTLDFSRLGAIRSAALETQAKLIVPEAASEDTCPIEAADPALESREAPARAEAAPPAGAPTAAEAPATNCASSAEPAHSAPEGAASASFSGPALTGAEAALLRALLAGEDPAPFIAALDRSTPRIIDDMNEKFFDIVGDAVLEEANGTLELITDYAEDVEAVLETLPEEA